MKTFILIIMIYYDGHSFVQTQEFNSPQTCEAARVAILGKWGTTGNYTVCAEK